MRQILRYGIIGVATNALGYLVYLGVTSAGFDPKTTMSVFYVIGATVGFFGNKKLSFAYNGNSYTAALRYVLAHTIGYSVNLVVLTVLVDWYGYPHQYVQAGAIFVVAAVLFLLFKFYVFPPVPTLHTSVPIPAPAQIEE
jgi:putative flippase GtrA